MASGVPVVSTNVGGVPFILRDDVTGLMVPAGNPQAMAAAVLRVLGDPEICAPACRGRTAGRAAIRMGACAPALGRCLSPRPCRSRGNPIARIRRACTRVRCIRESCPNRFSRSMSGLKGHSTVAVRNALEASQWWPRRTTRRWRSSRGLVALLRHANDYVPYYRELFRRIGFDPTRDDEPRRISNACRS